MEFLTSMKDIKRIFLECISDIENIKVLKEQYTSWELS